MVEELLQAAIKWEKMYQKDLVWFNGEIILALIANLSQERKEVDELRGVIADLQKKIAVANKGKHLVEQEAQIEKGRVASSEEKASQAINDYKASLAFELEVAKGSAKAYQLRFADYMEVILTRFPNLNLTSVKLPVAEKDDVPPPVEDVATSEAFLVPTQILRLLVYLLFPQLMNLSSLLALEALCQDTTYLKHTRLLPNRYQIEQVACFDLLG